MKDKHKIYAQVFSTKQGELVLEDLQEIWRSAPSSLDQQALAHLEGQRYVVRYIETLINKASKEG